MNRIKALVLAQFAIYWVFVVVLLVAAPDVYDSQLEQAVGLSSNRQLVEIGALLALTAFLAVLSIGIIRGWRWLFWLILIAFLAGILHLPAAALQLAGMVPNQSPAWYVVVQAVVGLIQFVTGLIMLGGYRKHGIWGTM